MNQSIKVSVKLTDKLIRLSNSCAWWNSCDALIEAAIYQHIPHADSKMVRDIAMKFNRFYDDTKGCIEPFHCTIEIQKDEIIKALWAYNVWHGKYQIVKERWLTFEQAHREGAISDGTYMLIASDRHHHLLGKRGHIVSWVKKRAQLKDFYLPDYTNTIVSVLN